MAGQNSNKDKPEKKVTEIRIDEDAISKFAVLGYSEPLPSTLVSMYREFKRRKDLINPGRMSSEGFAMVSILAEMIDGNLNFIKGD